MPDGSLQPLGLPVWRWDTFYIEIVRSIFDGAWDSDAAGARAVNYWWGMRSGAEEIDLVYSPKELMEMDWLDECVEGALPHYDELDVKTHVLMAINGLNTLKGFVK
ncbi:Uncharacterised protein [uncultured Clostridium sp.]|nr:Uncharacterised protein [uncultured Clostridium sp.]